MVLGRKLFLVLIGIIWCVQLFGQKPISIDRKSTISLKIREESESFKLKLLAKDKLAIELNTSNIVNFRILNPNAEVIHESLVINVKTFNWKEVIDLPGDYTLELGNVTPFFGTKVEMTIDLNRPQFKYGDFPMVDSLTSRRESKIMTDGDFRMRGILNGKDSRTYDYILKKGDSLIFNLIPVSGKSPKIEIRNSNEELVYASLSSKDNLAHTIPVLDSAQYTISMKSNPLFAKTNTLKVEKISPIRYLKPPVKKDTTDSVVVKKDIVLYDTIPEVFMDTVIFMGALRDIINPNSKKLSFRFENTSSIVFWGIMFGAGQEFLTEEDYFKPMLEGEAMAAGATDILSAYCLGFMKKLPGPGNGNVVFGPSKNIRDGLNPPIRTNYARVNQVQGTHFLSFDNKSRSAGQNVYVKIVLFRKEKI